MLSEELIDALAKRIGEAAKPAKVILFGSYARGSAGDDSDLDFLVIKPKVDDPGQEMIRLGDEAIAMRLPTDVDILVYSEADVDERRDWCTSPVYWALREGRTVYESGG